jgi:hypothetical protein
MAQVTVDLVAVMVVALIVTVIPEATDTAMVTPGAVLAKSGSNTTSGGAHQLRRSI